uniref:BZIP domain-containing protein n=1 Tax=Panagrolaimus davidi TaxID=227884 RepID=A0A914PH03_9BILA
MSDSSNNGNVSDYGNINMFDGYGENNVENVAEEWPEGCEYGSTVTAFHHPENAPFEHPNPPAHYQPHQNYVEGNPPFVYDPAFYPPPVYGEQNYANIDRQVPSADASMPFEEASLEDLDFLFEDDGFNQFGLEATAPIYQTSNVLQVDPTFIGVDSSLNNWNQDMINIDYHGYDYQEEFGQHDLYPVEAYGDDTVAGDYTNQAPPMVYPQHLHPQLTPTNQSMDLGAEAVANASNPLPPDEMQEWIETRGRPRIFTDGENIERRLICANESYHRRRNAREHERLVREAEVAILETINQNMLTYLNDLMNQYHQMLNNLTGDKRKEAEDRFRKHFK